MSNYIEHDGKVAFHPGYYLKEIVEDSGLTQEDFAKRLDTTPKNLSILIRGEQSLSVDISMKLSRMLGTSITYWLNLQSAFDAMMAEFKSEEELEEEVKVLKRIGYGYFRENYGLPELPRQIKKQTEEARNFLQVSTLTVFKKEDMAVSFRRSIKDLTEDDTIKANVMVQIATNMALKADVPKFNKTKFEAAIDYVLTLTANHKDFYRLIKDAFAEAGVVLVLLPNLPGSKINGATKKIGDNIMLMVNDRRLYADTFWFTLFHEIGHIMNGDYGISFEKERGENEKEADRYAQDQLIPQIQYREFVKEGMFDLNSIKKFAKKIDRDPGIVLGRLQNDKIVSYADRELNSLRQKYKIKL